MGECHSRAFARIYLVFVAIIETYESELFFLLDRRYHYPPDQVHVELIRREDLGESRVIDYDPLSADPDYLVVGGWCRYYKCYDSVLTNGVFRLVKTFGPLSSLRTNSRQGRACRCLKFAGPNPPSRFDSATPIHYIVKIQL